VPITCATPIIMAQPLGFYEKYGLDVDVIKTAGWAVARDKSLAGEYDASHMLTPMPLAMTLGAGSVAVPYIMPRSRTSTARPSCCTNEHKDKRDPKQWKGFKFGVPFDYSMHNFLLRYYVAEHGLDPDRTSRSASYRRRRWSPTCAPATSTATCRRTRSTSARSGRRSASSTS
jgi:nitrate/nitrite transport system substrate-binding protein